jgi:hypothetical protein
MKNGTCNHLLLVVLALTSTSAIGQAKNVVTQFTATETFTGIFVDFGKAVCPGQEPLAAFPPCPQGSRTQLRGMMRIYQDTSTDPLATGTNIVTENWNFDEYFVGPMWGTFRMTVTPGEVWEGTWTGNWQSSSGRIRMVGHGSGGRLEGSQIAYECEYSSGAGGPCVGRIINSSQR